MADALCGPSTALQALQKHVSTDRTFQDDRIFTHNLQKEKFRESQVLASGALDAEFEAFHSAPPLGLQEFEYDLLGLERASNYPLGALDAQFKESRSAPPLRLKEFKLELRSLERALNDTLGILDAEFEASHSAPPLGLEELENEHRGLEQASNHSLRVSNPPYFPNWALEFQALQINDDQTSRLSSSKLREQAPLHLYYQRGRHLESIQQKSRPFLSLEAQHISHIRDPHGANYSTIEELSNQTSSQLLSQSLQSMHLNSQAEELLDDEALERAFDAAEQNFSKLAVNVHPVVPQPTYKSFVEHVSKIPAPKPKEEHVSRQQPRGQDADDLARAAGYLLDNVTHEHNPKFQNSNFLSLMRQLRDREVHVEGDKIVHTAHPLHPGGQFYPQRNTPNQANNAYSPVNDIRPET